MSVTINEMHTDVVADGAGAAAPTGARSPTPELTPEKWQELQDRIQRDNCRTSAIDFED